MALCHPFKHALISMNSGLKVETVRNGQFVKRGAKISCMFVLPALLMPYSLNPVLTGNLVSLLPMEATDGPRLLEAASDGRLWEMGLTVIPGPDTVEQYLSAALAGRVAGTMMPFLIVRNSDGLVLGSTRFWKVDCNNRKLEVGHTWLRYSAQRSGANTEAKFLLLRHAFEVMGCVRVQFTTDELNDKSRNAILRIGAIQEGIVRHERIMPDGRKRNSVRFSIIDSEWPQVTERILGKMGCV